MTTGNSMWDSLMERQRATPKRRRPAVVRASISLDPESLNALDEMAGTMSRSAYVRRLIEAERARAPEERIRA